MKLSQPDQKLSAAAREIAELHSEIMSAARTSLSKAIRIGELLCNVKAQLDHGEFLSWLEANTQLRGRTPQRYMSCFERRDELKSVNVTDLSDAYRLLNRPKKTMQAPPASMMSTEQIEKLKKECSKDQLALIAAELPMKINDAAKLLGVSHNTVSNARKIIKHAPEKLKSIRDGKSRVSTVFESLRAGRQREQDQLAALETQRTSGSVPTAREQPCHSVPKGLRGVFNSILGPRAGLQEFIYVLDEEIGRSKLVAIAKRAEKKRLKIAEAAMKDYGRTVVEVEGDIVVWAKPLKDKSNNGATE